MVIGYFFCNGKILKIWSLVYYFMVFDVFLFGGVGVSMVKIMVNVWKELKGLFDDLIYVSCDVVKFNFIVYILIRY